MSNFILTTHYVDTVKRKKENAQGRAMRGFKESTQAQRFLILNGITQNLFPVGRHLLQVVNYRLLRAQAFQVWYAIAST